MSTTTLLQTLHKHHLEHNDWLFVEGKHQQLRQLMRKGLVLYYWHSGTKSIPVYKARITEQGIASLATV